MLRPFQGQRASPSDRREDLRDHRAADPHLDFELQGVARGAHRVVGEGAGTIKDYKEYHTESTVNFIVELTARGQAEIAEKGADAFFKLSCQISTTNMVLFDQDGKIKKYSSPEEILEDFYLLRLSFYQKRKEHLVDQLKLMYDKLSNQARFVQMIISRQLVVSNRKRADLVVELRQKDFRPFPKQGKAAIAAEPEDEEPVDEEDISSDSDYDYLLNMAIYNLTKEKVEKLLKERDAKEEELKILIGRSPQNLWDEDWASSWSIGRRCWRGRAPPQGRCHQGQEGQADQEDVGQERRCGAPCAQEASQLGRRRGRRWHG